MAFLFSSITTQSHSLQMVDLHGFGSSISQGGGGPCLGFNGYGPLILPNCLSGLVKYVQKQMLKNLLSLYGILLHPTCPPMAGKTLPILALGPPSLIIFWHDLGQVLRIGHAVNFGIHLLGKLTFGAIWAIQTLSKAMEERVDIKEYPQCSSVPNN